jgi:hypothetical protein
MCSKEKSISNSVYCVQENCVQYSRLFILYVTVNICLFSTLEMRFVPIL